MKSLPGATVTIGIDVGGTFTDVVVANRNNGTFASDKVLSMPGELSTSILGGLRKVLGDDMADALAAARIVHGTTLATNALLQHEIPKIGLITNRGFRDILEIRRHWRPELYDLRLRLPPPLVPRDLRMEVDGRLDPDGNVVTALDETGVAEVAEYLKAKGVVSYAICFLHSYARPGEEERAAEIVKQVHPNAYVTCSAAVCPEYREYERTSTAAVNAAVMPVIDVYLDNLEARLRENAYQRELYIMQSNGGMMTAPEIRRFPVNIIESGPAAGVIAAAAIGRQTGRGNLLSFDMGGTTAKAALIHDGEIEMSTEYEVGGSAHGARPGGGYSVRLPVMDIVEVGAGGGSIAWIDDAGALRVGPRSAGADPGPVCYRQGGTEPTTTDANLTLGRLSADYFLGGEMTLDAAGAGDAIETQIAQTLGLSPIDAAAGIVDVSNSHMVRALRRVSVEKGRHPRDYTMVAFGGAGPLHACYLAEELGVVEVIVPPDPGVASAVGMLGTDVRHEYRHAYFAPLPEVDTDAVNRILQELNQQGREALHQSGFADDAIETTSSAEIRYVGQAYELSVEWPRLPIAPGDLDQVVRRFHADHLRLYSFEMAGRPLELVSLRTIVVGVVEKPDPAPLTLATDDVQVKSRRPVHFGGLGMVDCPVYERSNLDHGHVFSGPAVVEQKDSTTLVPPNWRAEVDAFAHMLLRHDAPHSEETDE